MLRPYFHQRLGWFFVIYYCHWLSSKQNWYAPTFMIWTITYVVNYEHLGFQWLLYAVVDVCVVLVLKSNLSKITCQFICSWVSQALRLVLQCSGVTMWSRVGLALWVACRIKCYDRIANTRLALVFVEVRRCISGVPAELPVDRKPWIEFWFCGC
jgi:hypothetical protein